MSPAPVPASSFQTVRIADFTPGIRDNPGANYPAGTATTTSTTRCIALPGGGLTALPRRSTIYDGNDFLSANPASGSYLINGMFVAGPIIPKGGPTFSGAPAQIILGTEWQDATNRQLRIERLRVDESPLTRDTIKTFSVADASVVQSGWGFTWGITRAKQGFTVGDNAIPVIFFAWAPANNAAGWFVSEWPNDTAPSANGTYDLTSPTIDAQPTICVHQGRVVIAQVTAYDFGPASAFSTTENIRFTLPFDPTAASVSAISNYVPENPDGYTLMASMSANELFLLKQEGGVVVIGDLEDPTVTNLPMVTGAVDMHRPTPSPVGLVYGSRYSGIWSWQHGDGSTHLSPYMNPDFWTITTSEVLLANRYQFETVGKWVVAPNNFLYDTDTKSWWRLDDTSYAQVRFFSRKDRFLYGAVSTFTHTAKNAVFTWDLQLKASSYTWTSHPIWLLLNTFVDIREVVLEAKGQGTVTVTVRQADATTKAKTFTLANTGYPERLRVNFNARCFGVQVTIAADSGNAGINAPDIYAVDLNYQTAEHVRTD